MTTAYIGLGANLGRPTDKILSALASIAELSEIHLVAHSSLYMSNPIGPAGQPKYINAVAKLSTTLSPHHLLDALLSLETKLGRTREGTRWGPRIIDLDLLYYGERTINHHNLVLPHPEINNRNFVVYPLYEIEPGFVLPTGQLLSTLIDEVSSRGLERISPQPQI